MTEVDEIEQAAALAEAETGVRGAGAKLRLCRAPETVTKSRRWSAEDDAYIREHHGRQSEAAIAAHLGRTAQAVHIRWTRELRLAAPSKAPEILTAEQVSWGLGIGCGKTVHRLIDEGRMPGRRLPGDDVTRVVDRPALLRWMLEPDNWVYFRPERVNQVRGQGKRQLGQCYDFAFWESAREMVLKARAAWKDEWLTPMQAARIIGINPGLHAKTVNRAILRGNLRATRWGNWWIRRSDLPSAEYTINVPGNVVLRNPPPYQCPRRMRLHRYPSECRKSRFCRELGA